jgi:hypothetical protein
MTETASTSVLQSILTGADEAVEHFVFGAWDAIARHTEPWFTTALLLAVLLFAYGLLMGYVRPSKGEVARLVLALCVAYALVNPLNLNRESPQAGQRLSQGLANQSRLAAWLYTSITQVPGAIAREIGQLQITTVPRPGQNALAELNNSVDVALERGINAASLVTARGGISSWFWGVVLYAVVLFGTVPIAVTLVLSKFAVGALLGLAPFMSVLYLYAPTRRFVNGYFQQLLTFSITPVIVYGVVGMQAAMTRQVSESLVTVAGQTAPNMTFVVPYVIVMVITGWLAKQAPTWAGGIASGVSLALPALDASRAVSSVGGGILRAARTLAPYVPSQWPSFSLGRGTAPSATTAGMRPPPTWVQAHVRPTPRPELNAPPTVPAVGVGPSTPRTPSLGPQPRLLLGPGKEQS